MLISTPSLLVHKINSHQKQVVCWCQTQTQNGKSKATWLFSNAADEKLTQIKTKSCNSAESSDRRLVAPIRSEAFSSLSSHSPAWLSWGISAHLENSTSVALEVSFPQAVPTLQNLLLHSGDWLMKDTQRLFSRVKEESHQIEQEREPSASSHPLPPVERAPLTLSRSRVQEGKGQEK